MPQDNLNQALKSIHTILGDAALIDAEMAHKLQSLVVEINSAIAKSSVTSLAEESIPAENTLSNRLKTFISDFEVQHPKLTTNLSLVAERLADMGI